MTLAEIIASTEQIEDTLSRQRQGGYTTESDALVGLMAATQLAGMIRSLAEALRDWVIE